MDALILGTIVPMVQNVKLTAKIIATDTADIIGAGQCTFKADENVQKLLASAAPAGDTANPDKTAPQPEENKPFGDLKVSVESFKYVQSTDVAQVNTTLTLSISNTNASRTLGLAFPQSEYREVHLSNRYGEEIMTYKVTGTERAYVDQGDQIRGKLTDIPPRGSINVVSVGQWAARVADARPFRLQSMVFWGVKNDGRYTDITKYNLIVDII